MNKVKVPKPKKYRQNKVDKHFHPRGLARAIVHNKLTFSEMSGQNKVKPGTTQSPFALHWREEAETFAR